MIFLVVLMGIGGIALAGFSQKALKSVEESKHEHNKRVLQEAKQALLMYAYNYPAIALAFNNTDRGPGRLPCPDTDNSGTPNPPCSVGNPLVGRLPINTNGINFYNAVDSAGEPLWYAVSSAFNNQSAIINSDTVGTITIYDQTGGIIYDGASAGVAAIIAAPGAPLAGQDRNAAPNDPAQYLDSFAGFSNSAFNNGESDTDDDGFILGPVFDAVQNNIVVNDQIIIITTEEVVEMAEKATLQAYKQAIDEYLNNTGLNNYPWLFDYNTDELKEFRSSTTTSTIYPDGALSNIGRVPSIFSNYFSEADSKTVEGVTRVIVNKSFEMGSPFPLSYTMSINQLTGVFTNIRFEDGTSGDDKGFLRATGDGNVYNEEVYFSETFLFSDDWQICPPPAASLTDCNRDSVGDFTTGSNNWETRVMWVGIDLDFTGNVEYEFDYSTPPNLTYFPATNVPENHARIRADFLPGDMSVSNGTLYWERGIYEVGGTWNYFGGASQSLDSNNDTGLLTNLSTGIDTFMLHYFPELPLWAHPDENGWHNSIMMAYAADYLPSGDRDCTTPALSCLVVGDIGGVNNNKVALLTIAGEVAALTDGGVAGYTDDLIKIFDPENDDTNGTFLRRQGNDTVMVLR